MVSPSAIQTFTGAFFDPFAPDPGLIDIRDIAHALANQCRYSGHTRVHWSVAAHSCLVSACCSSEFRLEALLHDGHEAYVLDLPTPLKRHESMQPYRSMEQAVEQAVRFRFGLPLTTGLEIRHADRIALWAEAEELLHGTSDWVTETPHPNSELEIKWARERIREMLGMNSERLFLSTFNMLKGVDVHAD